MPAFTDEQRTRLVNIAIETRLLAYAPYSNFQVGAALLTAEGMVFSGCNVENASYGLAICAERSAICKAISEGHREFIAIAVAAHPLATPCGACRQFIAEFGGEIEVIAVDPNAQELAKSWTSSQLLPERFEFK